MSEFNFGSLKKKQPIKEQSIPKPVKMPPSKPKQSVLPPRKPLTLDEYINNYESVIKAMLQCFEGHVIRHDQKNPISRIDVDIASLPFDLQFYKKLHKLGLLEKTKYSSQWKIKTS